MDLHTKLWNLADIANYLGVSRSTAHRYSRRAGFPACFSLSERTLRWAADEVGEWVQSRAVSNAALPIDIPEYLLKDRRTGPRLRRAA